MIAERRDIRRFRPDPVPDDVLERVLAAAHRAPSVGLMQPWRLIVIRGIAPRIAIRDIAARERLRQADRFDERARAFLDQKIEGIVEAPLGVCVCCHHGAPGEEILGRGTIPETDVYSTACAIQNLWLAARAEGLGVGWVSFYRLADLRAILGIPARVDPIAYLCIGWPDERPVRPGLETSGWAARLPLERVVMAERWEEPAAAAAAGAATAAPDAAVEPPAAGSRARPRRRDPRARSLRPARQARRQPRRARVADRALGGGERRAAAAADPRRRADLRRRPRPHRARHEPLRQRGLGAGRGRRRAR